VFTVAFAGLFMATVISAWGTVTWHRHQRP
jgi:hypothetical protein